MQLAAEFEEPQVLIHPRDGAGRRQARRAVASVAAADGAERLGGAVHEVRPVAAVDVQVDEPRREVGIRRDRSPWRILASNRAGWNDAAIDDGEVAPFEPVGQYQRRVRENRYTHCNPSALPRSC